MRCFWSRTFHHAGLGGSVGCASDWRPGGRGFDPPPPSTVILCLPLIQEGQLSVSGERMCTILVNRLEDKACPVNVWLGKLTALDMTPLGWLGRKTSTQTNKLSTMNVVNLNPFMQSALFHINSLDGPFQVEEMSDYFSLMPYLKEIPVFDANSVDPDQIPVLQHLIGVYTVFECPFYWMPGINGLTCPFLMGTKFWASWWIFLQEYIIRTRFGVG